MGFDEIIKELLNIVRKFTGIEQVILFGSFAKNTQTKTSDIDIAISGEFDYFELLDAIKSNINTLRQFDIINYDEICSSNLKREIDEHGKLLYSKV